MRELRLTSDGSHTLFESDLNEHFHSIHGAIQESLHVYIEHGLSVIQRKQIKILEIGFGTGLNALLSFIHAEENKLRLNYTSIEKYPLKKFESDALNYGEILKSYGPVFKSLHAVPWEIEATITENFSILKLNQDIQQMNLPDSYDLIYFDAFGPDVQPDLWNLSIFDLLAQHMNTGAIFTTYSAKGSVRGNLMAVGLHVERIPGPPGKRQMIRARKLG